MMRSTIAKQPAWMVWSGCALVALGLTFAAHVGLVKPTHERQQKTEQALVAATAQRDQTATLEQQVAVIDELMRSRRATLAANPLTLGNRDELNRRIAALIGLAQSEGLEVLQLQPGEETPGEHYDLIHLRLEAGAAFGQYLTFLGSLHETFADMSVVAMELESPRGAEVPRPRGVIELVWFTAVREDARSAGAGR